MKNQHKKNENTEYTKTRRNSLPVSLSQECLLSSYESNYIDDGETERLGKKPVLQTVLSSSVGPLISQMIIAFYGIVNSLWIAKSIGDDGTAVLGAVFIVEFVATALAEYLMTCITLRASFCFGEQQGSKVAQLYVDFIRIALFLGIITPLIVLPITKPLVHWFGASDKLSNLCLQYMIPSTSACFLNFIYQMNLGLLEAQGHSILFGIIQIISFAMNIGFLAITLLWLKLPIWGASLSIISSQAIPGIILLFIFFNGTFSIKPELKMFFKSFSDQTLPALKIGISSLIVAVSYTIPLILMQKYVNSAATRIGIYDYTIQVWAIIEKVYAIVSGICIGFNFGFVPVASYAYGAKLWDRVKMSSLHMLWVSTLCSVLVSIVLLIWPDKIASIWNNDPTFLYWAKKMIPRVFYACPFIPIQYMVPGLLQSMQMVLDATILSIVTLLIPYPLFSSILYFTNDTDPARVFYTYAIADCFSFIVCSILIAKAFRKLKQIANYQDNFFSHDRQRRHSNHESTSLSFNDDEI